MNEFKARRDKLAEQMQPGSIAILAGAKQILRTASSHFPFRQNNDFYYLSGFIEPDALFVLCKDMQGTIKYILFSMQNDPVVEVWEGKKIGQDDAKTVYLADEAYDLEQISKLLPNLIIESKIIYYALGLAQDFDNQVIDWLKQAKKIARSKYINFKTPEVIDILPMIHELRVVKTTYEIEQARKAAEISAAAHTKLIQKVQPGLYEYQLEAIFIEHCTYNGARAQAYPAIVAGGSNACTLHYVANDKKLQAGDLVLVDAGGEYNYYAADITRTYPVSGKFTQEQRSIYQLVLDAQLQGIAQVKPGNTFESIQQVMVEVIVKGLLALGLLKGDLAELIKDNAYIKFYMHSSGHWLGLDVHDAGSYKIDNKSRKLVPGMILTVEPGIYIPNDIQGVDPIWFGIGVRIEDDILVTSTGHEVLSQAAPKSIAEIESATV